MKSARIKEMTVQMYKDVDRLWRATEGVGLSEADSKESIGRFLERNPGLSFSAWEGQLLVGTILCGNDGRRGYIHHLTVRTSHRRRGIASALVRRCLEGLKAVSIDKCHLFVFADNHGALNFWKDTGWTQRIDLIVMSHYTVERDVQIR
jgi:ribosomal protein S18 acetylase RimI-like enzyme